MKILLATGIYPPDAGGPATYTRAMARALVEREHEVEVICYADTKSEVGSRKSEENNQASQQAPLPAVPASGVDKGGDGEGFAVTRISRDQSRRNRYREYEEEAYKLAKNVDLVYLQGPVSEGYPGTRAARRANKPTVMKVVGDYAWEIYMQSGGGKKELLDEFITHRHFFSPKIYMIEKMERETVTYASRIITPSHYLKSIVEKWGVPSEKVEVIYNEVQPLPDGMSREEARKQFGVEGKRVLFTAVRAVPWKNIDFIIKLLPKLDQDIVLVVAGDGPSLESWKAVAKSTGVQDRVTFLGKLDRKALGEWYRAADLFVLPSSYEGYPNVFPEALSQGLPSFFSRAGWTKKDVHVFSRSQTANIVPFKVLESNQQDWIDNLTIPWPSRFEPAQISSEANFDAMAERTIKVLQSVLPTPYTLHPNL